MINRFHINDFDISSKKILIKFFKFRETIIKDEYAYFGNAKTKVINAISDLNFYLISFPYTENMHIDDVLVCGYKVERTLYKIMKYSDLIIKKIKSDSNFSTDNYDIINYFTIYIEELIELFQSWKNQELSLIYNVFNIEHFEGKYFYDDKLSYFPKLSEKIKNQKTKPEKIKNAKITMTIIYNIIQKYYIFKDRDTSELEKIRHIFEFQTQDIGFNIGFDRYFMNFINDLYWSIEYSSSLTNSIKYIFNLYSIPFPEKEIMRIMNSNENMREKIDKICKKLELNIIFIRKHNNDRDIESKYPLIDFNIIDIGVWNSIFGVLERNPDNIPNYIISKLNARISDKIINKNNGSSPKKDIISIKKILIPGINNNDNLFKYYNSKFNTMIPKNNKPIKKLIILFYINNNLFSVVRDTISNNCLFTNRSHISNIKLFEQNLINEKLNFEMDNLHLLGVSLNNTDEFDNTQYYNRDNLFLEYENYINNIQSITRIKLSLSHMLLRLFIRYYRGGRGNVTISNINDILTNIKFTHLLTEHGRRFKAKRFLKICTKYGIETYNSKHNSEILNLVNALKYNSIVDARTATYINQNIYKIMLRLFNMKNKNINSNILSLIRNNVENFWEQLNDGCSEKMSSFYYFSAVSLKTNKIPEILEKHIILKTKIKSTNNYNIYFNEADDIEIVNDYDKYLKLNNPTQNKPIWMENIMGLQQHQFKLLPFYKIFNSIISLFDKYKNNDKVIIQLVTF